MFAFEPVKRLSSTVTSAPCASRRRASCEPMKPAPPVTRHLRVFPIMGRVLRFGKGGV